MKGARCPDNPRSVGGFTLLELSLVLILAALLVVVAIPFYRNQWLGVGRLQAVATIMDVRQRQQAFFAQHRRYALSLESLGYPHNPFAIDRQGKRSDVDHAARIYKIVLATDAGGYIVTAQPQLSQARDQRCGVLSLSGLGVAGVAGSAGVGECWRVVL